MIKKLNACISIRFTEEGRSRLCFILAVVHWVCILGSLVLVGTGAYIKLTVQEFTSLVKNYDGDTLPYLLIAVGLLSAISDGLGGWLTFENANPEKRIRYRHFLFAYVIVTLCISVCTLAGGIMCFTHISHLHDSFAGGLMDAMKHYKHKPDIKREVDLLQMRYQCCGNEEYTDWFHISWVHEDYINIKNPETKKKITADGYESDDTPFSCCSVKSPRPCIHHHVHSNNKHLNYDYRQSVTLNTEGCKQALMDFFGDKLLTEAGATVLGVFFLQLVIAIVSRFLQTSLSRAAMAKNPQAPAYGYLFDCDACMPEEDEDDIKMDPEALVPLNESDDDFDSQDSFEDEEPMPEHHHDEGRRHSTASRRYSQSPDKGAYPQHYNPYEHVPQRQMSGAQGSYHNSPHGAPPPPPPGPPPPPPPPGASGSHGGWENSSWCD